MIPNHNMKNRCFTKHPLRNGCLGCQGCVFFSIQKMCWPAYTLFGDCHHNPNVLMMTKHLPALNKPNQLPKEGWTTSTIVILVWIPRYGWIKQDFTNTRPENYPLLSFLEWHLNVFEISTISKAFFDSEKSRKWLHPAKLAWQRKKQQFWRCISYETLGDFSASHVSLLEGKGFKPHLENCTLESSEESEDMGLSSFFFFIEAQEVSFFSGPTSTHVFLHRC